MRQLQDILPHLYSSGSGMNFLLRGPSGWGKTRLALLICNYLDKNFQICLGDSLQFNDSVRVHFIDEVHLLEHPEVLYPRMDSGKYIIVLATNDVALLPEALSNRCTEFIFDRYTLDEMREILRTNLASVLPLPFMDYIIESGGYNPRIVKGLAGRINLILSRRPHELDGKNLDQFKVFMEDVFGIKDGLDVMCVRYMEALAGLGGTASLQTISSLVHIDQNTLRYNVEPVLLYKKLIKISSKGRSLV